jgi:hypothetical protein
MSARNVLPERGGGHSRLCGRAGAACMLRPVASEAGDRLAGENQSFNRSSWAGEQGTTTNAPLQIHPDSLGSASVGSVSGASCRSLNTRAHRFASTYRQCTIRAIRVAARQATNRRRWNIIPTFWVDGLVLDPRSLALGESSALHRQPDSQAGLWLGKAAAIGNNLKSGPVRPQCVRCSSSAMRAESLPIPPLPPARS